MVAPWLVRHALPPARRLGQSTKARSVSDAWCAVSADNT